MGNKWLKDLKKLDFAIKEDYDSFSPENCFYTPSPYMNWTTANESNGFPKNSSLLLFSEPKSGKSLLCMSAIADMQKRDPEGIAVYISTEHRGQTQVSSFMGGIDMDRTLILDTDDPKEIVDDLIEGMLKPQVQDGMPLRLLIIDSITGIKGVKRKNADTIEQHLIGDQALTIGNVLQVITPWCKRNNIFNIGTAQLRANIDGGHYGPKTKMAASFSVKHAYEYFVSVKRAGAAEDKQDIEGKTFEEEGLKDARGNKLLNGHKVYVKMEESSLGPAGRSGVFTLSYSEGIINQHEEIFHLGKNLGILKTENNRTYFFGEHKFNGKKEAAQAIKDNPELAAQILEEIKKLDAKK